MAPTMATTASMTTTPTIETHELTRCFGDVTAVDRLTLTVQAGEVFGLLGPNGAGKSTVVKMLATLLPPSSGTARVVGFDIVHQAARVRREIGYVPQALSADGTLTGYENLLVFAKLYDVPHAARRKRIEEALTFMGLAESANKLVHTYSGGMIRRLEIALAVLHQPQVLFLDEPTIGLDPLARAAVWDHLERLRQETGMTIFMTTHYMDEAAEQCMRVAIMHHGVVAVVGTPQALVEGLHQPGATLDDVFVRYAGDALESGGSYREARRTRRVVSRLS